MIIFKEAGSITRHLQEQQSGGVPVGFVPTMGALHAGHLSLVTTVKNDGGLSVCSIFVNPTQFNNATDFARYPITVAADIQLLENAGCDVLFLPDVAQIYPDGTILSSPYHLGYLETVLEGKYRPGHFQGVCQVVHRLLDIIQPNRLYLGSKDYQQCMVIRKLVELKQLAVEVIACPTLRETDGLAMSSRNMRLDASARQKATAIYATLMYIRQQVQPGPLDLLLQTAGHQLAAQGFEVDYVAIADARSLQLYTHWDGNTPLVALIAATIGGIRLIDNMVL